MIRSFLSFGLAFSLCTPALHAQTPDASFGSNGLFIYATDAWEEFRDVALMSDGRAVAVGTRSTDVGSDLRVVRLQADGTLDASFSGDGAYNVTIADGNTQGLVVAVQADGKVLAAGTTEQAGARHMFVVRLLANGDPDVAFATGGTFVSNVDVGGEHLTSLLVAADGKVVLGGDVVSSITTSACIIRLTTAGVLDNGFADGGIWRHNAFGGTELMTVNTMGWTPSGQLLAAGVTDLSSNNDVFVLRLLDDGGLDPNYGVAGETVITDNAYDEYASAMAVAPGGDVYLAGTRFGIGGDDLVFYHIAADGTPQNFGSDILWQLISDGSDYTSKVVLDSGGRLLVAVTTYDVDFVAHAAVLRVLPDASLDPAFGAGGWLQVNDLLNTAAYGVALRPDGKIVAAGNSYPMEGNSEGWMTRFVDPFAGIDAVDADLHATIAPNPCEGRFTLMAGGGRIDRLQVLDAAGRLVLDERFSLATGGTRVIELPAGVRAGVYAAVLWSGERRDVRRLAVR